MLDWIAVLGLQGLVGFVFKDILLKLLQGALEDYVKDFFKQSIRDVTTLAKEPPLQKAFGAGLKEFLLLVQQELEDADLSLAQIEELKPSLTKYLEDSTVLENLGIPFETVLGKDDRAINTATLKEQWAILSLQRLPDEFDWIRLVKRYTRKVETIVRESDDLRKLMDSENLARLVDLLEGAVIAPDFDVSKYQKKLQTAYSHLRLDSLDTDGWTYRLRLETMFVSQPISVWPSEGELLPNTAKSLLSSKGLKYTVILGNPGSGKSTLLQYQALSWANSAPSRLPLMALPLLIELRNYIDNLRDNRCGSFLEYLHKGTGVVGGTLNQTRLKSWLKHGKTLIMFDGLDEVLGTDDRLQVIEDIINFAQDYPKVRIVVTSRVVGYEPQRFATAKFRHFILRDLRDNDIEGFLKNWHNLAFDDKKEGELKRSRLQKTIDTSRTFRELAGNPLLLTMMAILNRNEQLPRDRPTLYERASEVLLQRWDMDRGVEDPNLDPRLRVLDYRDKQEMLRQVAHHMYIREQHLPQTASRNLLINRDELLNILAQCLQEQGFLEPLVAARSLLRPLTTRSFILTFMGGESYGFVHRTFQEYFCAWCVVRKFEKLQQLSLEDLKQMFGDRWQDESWHEILSLITGRIDARFAGEIIEYLLNQAGEAHDYLNVRLATQCFRDVRNVYGIRPSTEALRRHLGTLSTAPEASDTVRQFAQNALKEYWADDGSLLVD